MAISVPAGGSGNLNLMTLSELIRSSALIHSKRGKYGYSMNQAVQKEFGTIYYNNKTVIYNPDTHILEIRMGMGTKTETAYKGMHSVRMAIYGVEGTIYDSLEELYMDKTGMTADSEDMNDMRKAIRGETSAQIDRRLANADKDWENATKKEANKFSLTYDDKNARLEGYIIPVAAMDSKSGAYTYEDSGRIFYMEKPIDVNSFVRVSCSCTSYYIRNSWYNYQAGAHLGMQPAAYPGKNSYSETVMNVTKSPGMCKHLMMFTMLLLNGGIISKANTKGFQFNMEAIRNRTEKLNVPRKLADSGDWGNHLRELQRSLLKADQRRYSQMGQTLTDQYNKWKKAQIEHNSITFDKSMNPRKGVNKSTFASNAPMNTFGQDIQNMRAQYGDYADQIMTPRTQRVLDLFRHNI